MTKDAGTTIGFIYYNPETEEYESEFEDGHEDVEANITFGVKPDVTERTKIFKVVYSHEREQYGIQCLNKYLFKDTGYKIEVDKEDIDVSKIRGSMTKPRKKTGAALLKRTAKKMRNKKARGKK